MFLGRVVKKYKSKKTGKISSVRKVARLTYFVSQRRSLG